MVLIVMIYTVYWHTQAVCRSNQFFVVNENKFVKMVNVLMK